MTVSYVVPLFPYLERNDVYQSLLAYTSSNYVNSLVYMPLLICPSNPPTTQSGAPLAYAINGGQSVSSSVDVPAAFSSGTHTANQTNALAAASGIAYDLSGNNLSASPNTGVKGSQDYIVAHDGSSMTLLLSENDNITNQTWAPATAVVGTTMSPAVSLSATGAAGLKYGLTFQWSGLTTAAAGTAPVTTSPPASYNRINGNKGQNQASNMTYAYARPASNHPGGVVVAFCDGHVRFIAEDIPYYVYKQLMTPWGYATNDTDQGTAFPLNDSSY